MKIEKSKDEGGITPMGGAFVVTNPRPGISLTRNKDLRKPYTQGQGPAWDIVRIVLDGDRLARRNKMEPYVDRMHSVDRSDNQQEELVRQNELNIKDALMRVDVNVDEYMQQHKRIWLDNLSRDQHYAQEVYPILDEPEQLDPEFQEEYHKYMNMEKEDIEAFLQWMKSQNIPHRVVKDFRKP